MNESRLNRDFSGALRTVLTARVDAEAPVKERRYRRLWFGSGICVGVGLLGGVGAAAAGILVLPGGANVTVLAAPVVETHSGTATVDLGPAPAGVTSAAVELTCLTPGRFVFDDGASIVCTAADMGTSSALSGGYNIPLAPGQHTLQVSTDPAASWTLRATYVRQATTDWAINSQGQRYGVINAYGTPDLVAVVATNGKNGYARSKDLFDADGTAASNSFKSPDDAIAWQEANRGKKHTVPVYESDGTTRVGEFIVGGP